MSDQVTIAYTQQFNAGIRLLQQQEDSRLRQGVLGPDDVVGDRAFFDQVGITSMSLVTNRHGSTTYTDTPHARRMVTLALWDVADLVDRADTRRLLNNPINAYSRAMASASNRTLDTIILTAMDATASTGVDGTGTAAFDATNFSFNASGASQILIVNDIAGARRRLEAAENMEDEGDNKWFAALSAVSREHLYRTTEVTSADFNTVKALARGAINEFLGFTFLKSQLAAIDASNIRDNFFWVKKSMGLAVSEESRSFVDILPTRRHSTQIRFEMDAGSTRLDEVGVVRILVDES